MTDWKFDLRDTIRVEEKFSILPEEAERTAYTVTRRLIDDDTGERFYWVEYAHGDLLKTQLKLAMMVERDYERVDIEDISGEDDKSPSSV